MTAPIENELRRHLAEWAEVDIPPVPDLSVVQRESRTRAARRHAWTAAAIAAAAVVILIVSVTLAIGPGRGRVEPAPPVDPTPSLPEPPTDTDEAIDPVAGVANGRLVSAEERFAPALEPCVVRPESVTDYAGGCAIWALDASPGIGLFRIDPSLLGDDPVDTASRIRVATPTKVLAELPCPPNDCFAASLGPGSDELSLPGSQAIRVVGLDGADRRTIDLSGVLVPPRDAPAEGEYITSVAWSPDRSRIAVRTSLLTGHGSEARLWVVDQDGGRPRLVHTALYDGPPTTKSKLTYLWSVAWSPDGSRLGFIQESATLGRSETSHSIRAVSLTLPAAEEEPDTARTLYEYRQRPFDEAVILWSPDATRVALRVPGQVLELSADAGTVLAEHDTVDGFIMWLAKES